MRSKVVVLALLLWECGCAPIDHEAEICGRYRLSSGRLAIALEVRGDHTYTEVVTCGHAQEEKASGRWHWDSLCVVFDGLAIPTEVLADEDRAREKGDGGSKRSSPRSDKCLGAERWFGETKLVLDVDRDIYFKLVANR